MSVQFSFQIPFRLTAVTKVKQLLQKVIKDEGFSIDNISIVLVSDEFLYDMNLKYLNHDYYTDIITFNYTSRSSTTLNGELYISIDRAKENAKIQNVSLQNELLRLMIHGILHLCHYNDATLEEKSNMTTKENHYLDMF